MSDFETPASFQAAFEQLDQLATAAANAATVSVTVETDLLTLTLSASPRIESLTYAWAAFRGVGAEALADATRAAIADATVRVQQAQAEALRATPALASVLDASAADMDLPPEVAAQAQAAAEHLAEVEIARSAPDGTVEVTVDGTGVITRLWFTATAGRESAAEWLGDTVASTINDALQQARRVQEEQLSGGASADLEAQLDELVGAHEARIEGLMSRLDEVSRRLDLL